MWQPTSAALARSKMQRVCSCAVMSCSSVSNTVHNAWFRIWSGRRGTVTSLFDAFYLSIKIWLGIETRFYLEHFSDFCILIGCSSWGLYFILKLKCEPKCLIYCMFSTLELKDIQPFMYRLCFGWLKCASHWGIIQKCSHFTRNFIV